MTITIDGTGNITGLVAGGLPDLSVTNADLAADAVSTSKVLNNAITAAKLGSNEQSGLCKAWVNFNGTASSNLTGTYSISGTTTLTVTATSHGFSVGQAANLNFTTGSGTVNGTYTVVTVPDANTFTITHGTAVTTSGNVTINRNTIRASYNVSSITDNGTGDYTVNFTTALADSNYSAVSITNSETGDSNRPVISCFIDSISTSGAARIRTVGTYNNNTRVDVSACTVAIFR